MMLYLLFFRTVTWFGLPSPSGHTNVIQMFLTLKLIGVAFERNSVLTKSQGKEVLLPVEAAIKDIRLIDLFHYCFNYIGLLNGPYYTYRTFHDYFHLPFAVHAENSFKTAMDKLKIVPIYVALLFVTSYIWPLSYATSEEFYNQRSWMYRLFYIWPSVFIFRMRMYSGIILADCVCVCSGFGAYPKELEAKCGQGPSNDITQELLDKPENREYDFKTMVNVEVRAFETCLTFREAMKHWNRSVQYWLAMYVYKKFPSKNYRIIATMAVSAYWHGVHGGYYFCILGPIVYLPVEDLYVKLLKNDKASKTQQSVTGAFFWILKFFAANYMGIAFLLSDASLIWRFYVSVYHFAYFFWAALYIVCYFLLKQKRTHTKNVVEDENLAKSRTQLKKSE